MAHREGIREYLKDVKLVGVVADWGAGTKPITNYLENLGCEYYSFDKLEHVKPTRIVDLEKPQPQMIQADMAFCLEVIEHIWRSETLIYNIRSNLRLGGVLYLSQPFMYEVHKEDDRIRYTYHGLKQLLEDMNFEVLDIQPTVGDLDHAEGYILKAVKK